AAISGKTPEFVEGDVRDRALLDRLFAERKIGGAIHFAALKAVGESVAQPLAYYDNNLNGLLTLCAAMQAARVKTLVFS
ncbi:NAD-dependent epimerase/dehydratase family protein, partial [Acinetobacter baumannii]